MSLPPSAAIASPWGHPAAPGHRPGSRRSRQLLPLLLAVAVSLLGDSVRAGGAVTTIEVAINGMVCSFCAQGVERSVRRLPGTDRVELDLTRRLLSVTMRPGATIADEQLRSVIRHAGFEVRQIRRTASGT